MNCTISSKQPDEISMTGTVDFSESVLRGFKRLLVVVSPVTCGSHGILGPRGLKVFCFPSYLSALALETIGAFH